MVVDTPDTRPAETEPGDDPDGSSVAQESRPWTDADNPGASYGGFA